MLTQISGLGIASLSRLPLAPYNSVSLILLEFDYTLESGNSNPHRDFREFGPFNDFNAKKLQIINANIIIHLTEKFNYPQIFLQYFFFFNYKKKILRFVFFV